MQSKTLFNENGHQWIVIGRDPHKDAHVIDTNEYVIISRGQAMLLDPGGIQIFPQVLAELAKYVRVQDIRVIFASHQDPDISSSLAMWLDLNPDIKTYCSWLWTGFISHFSTGTAIELNAIPDEGMRIKIGPNTKFTVKRAVRNRTKETEESVLRIDEGSKGVLLGLLERLRTGTDGDPLLRARALPHERGT